MKSFKAICAAFVIALSLSIPAYAEDPKDPNDIHQPGIPSGTLPKNDLGATGGTTPSGGDITSEILANILLTLASFL